MKLTKKTLIFMLFFMFLLFCVCLTIWKTSSFPRVSLLQPFKLKGIQKPPSRDPKFRILLNGKLFIEEDFNDRPKDSIFEQLRGNDTVEVDEENIGALYPISTEGPPKKFSLDVIFRPTISQTDKILFLYLFQKFIDICARNNISYFLYDGSLIGSYRHHGLIPWDDDVDVFVNSSQKQLLAKVGAKVPGFQIFTLKSFQWKFFHQNLSTDIDGKRFRWPYIDIFFWKTDPTHLYDYTRLSRGTSYNLTIVFPLQPRPFEGVFLNCPLRTGEFLRRKYDITKCQTNTFSHLYEEVTRWHQNVPCAKLEHLYPFVKHHRTTSCKETLVHKSKIIQTFTLKNC